MVMLLVGVVLELAQAQADMIVMSLENQQEPHSRQ
jgi:hypothetical protein